MKVTNPDYKLLLCPLFILVFLVGCHQKGEVKETSTLFRLLAPDSSGIHFINRISPDDTINILTYEYLYNGGGVGVGDFNRDGFEDIFFAGSQVPGKLYINNGNAIPGSPLFRDMFTCF